MSAISRSNLPTPRRCEGSCLPCAAASSGLILPLIVRFLFSRSCLASFPRLRRCCSRRRTLTIVPLSVGPSARTRVRPYSHAVAPTANVQARAACNVAEHLESVRPGQRLAPTIARAGLYSGCRLEAVGWRSDRGFSSPAPSAALQSCLSLFSARRDSPRRHGGHGVHTELEDFNSRIIEVVAALGYDPIAPASVPSVPPW